MRYKLGQYQKIIYKENREVVDALRRKRDELKKRNHNLLLENDQLENKNNELRLANNPIFNINPSFVLSSE